MPADDAREGRGHRHDDRGAGGTGVARHRRRVRAALRAAVRIPDARQGARDRGGRGRGGRAHRIGGATGRRRSRRARGRSRRSQGTASTRPARSARRRSTRATTCGRATRFPARRSSREPNATTVVEPGWRATLTPRDDLVLERVEEAKRAHAIGTTADPVLLEVFNNLFMAIAEQMGVTLANTAYSVNIKERLDFSCALFDADGQLIANAPHMPVHLGSMGESVKTVIDRRTGTMKPRRRVRAERALQRRHAPAGRDGHRPRLSQGGGAASRIPPLPFAGEGARRDGRAPSPRMRGEGRGEGRSSPSSSSRARGHHADIGGITPGSMPPDSSHVDEEGVLLDNVQLVAAGRFLEDEMRAILDRRPLSGAQRSSRTSPTCAPRWRPARKGSTNSPEDGRAFLAAGGARLHEARSGQRRGVGAPRAGRAEGRRVRVRDGRRRGHPRRDPRRPREARGGDRLHRHERAAADQLQRAVGRVQGGRALRVPHARRRRDPDERRVPQAAHDRDPRGVDARAALSGGGRRGQRRDLAGDHRLPLRRARRARGLAGHDEQLHVRQRHLPVLRDDLGRDRARGRTSTERASCRRT